MPSKILISDREWEALGSEHSSVDAVLPRKNDSDPKPVPTPASVPPADRKLNVEDALLYLDQVKLEFSDRPHIYNEFLQIMKEFKAKAADTPSVVQRVRRLFHGHDRLITGFNIYLPNEHETETRDSESATACKDSAKDADSTSAGQRSKKPRKSKDPNKPKHPMSAYLFFAAATRPQLRAQGVPVSGAMLGNVWRSLDKRQLRVYEGMAAEDNARYYREMEAYREGRLRYVTPPPSDIAILL